MSLLNVAIRPEFALVLVDTATAPIAGAPKDLLLAAFHAGSNTFCKGFSVPSRGVFIAGRGNPAFFSLVAMSVLVTPGDGFDDLVPLLPTYLAQRRADLCNMLHMASVDANGPAIENEIAVVGWSEAAGEMRGVVFACGDSASDFDREDLVPGQSYCAPWAEGWGAMPDMPEERGEAAALALRQAERMRADMPAGAIGGRMLCTEVRRWGMSTELVCEF
jgi:hypothetical protein